MIPAPAGVLLDLDGTIYELDAPIPGAAEAVARLRRAGIAVRFCTNTTRMPRRALGDRLAAFGIPAAVDDVITAPSAAAAWLKAEGIERVALYVADDTREDFAGFTLADVPEAVVLGDLADGWTFDVLNRAFRQVLGGARLVALQRNRYWKTADGLSLDAGPFVAALEFATGARATLVGKPSRAFFLAAAASLGVPQQRIVVVGDDVSTDVAGAQAAGLRGVLVRTGKYRPGDEGTVTPAPTAVVDSVADLPGLLGV
ncbi:MAG: TIGR01458 family HAD-type hydrolase [Gemmatimonadota bacterium]|nr:TIGR01458 family HAD-type hydrolase [Gemmatimonadota bacterium]MDH5196329.1 TIGR01458 family HAD-type hydrolase [Gemmatimonadota bacterium]